MFKQYGLSFFVLLCVFVNVSVASANNPFAKNNSLNIGKDVSWDIDKELVLATKSAGSDGIFYHLRFDNKALELFISTDVEGNQAKTFTQLEIKNVSIDGQSSALFNWCLNNQEGHNRFLQQGLSVKRNVCEVNGDAGSFVMHLNRDTLTALKKGKRLSIMVKPYRTPLDLNYDISDFDDMFLALNAKTVRIAENTSGNSSASAVNKKCWAGPPAKYKNIQAVEYDCNDASAKKDAEAWVIKLVSKQKTNNQQVVAAQAKVLAEKNREKQRLRIQAEEKKKKQLATQRKQVEAQQLEQKAIAASAIKQAKIGDEITQKMVKMCSKYWDVGEHRCYCQKYIEHAPSSIQANSSCN